MGYELRLNQGHKRVVARATLHTKLPLWRRLDVGPFVACYALCAALLLLPFLAPDYLQPAAPLPPGLHDGPPGVVDAGAAAAVPLDAEDAARGTAAADVDVAPERADAPPPPGDSPADGVQEAASASDAGEDAEEEWELAPSTVWALTAAAVAAAAHALLELATVWHPPFRAWLHFASAPTASGATHVLCVPPPHGGEAALCPLQRLAPASDGDDIVSPIRVGASKRAEPRGAAAGGERASSRRSSSPDGRGGAGDGDFVVAVPRLWFTFQQVRFCLAPGCDAGAGEPLFERIDHPDACRLGWYVAQHGHSDASARAAEAKWGRNAMDVPMPAFAELYKQHVVAPFFVFQLFCVRECARVHLPFPPRRSR